MGELFNNILSSDESLFLNPQFLDTDYQPKLVPFRENQQRHIANCIKPLLQKRNGKNIIAFGRPGVGKTVCLKHVLNELEEEYDKEAYCLYVNCWKKDTPFKVITEICEQLKYKWIHNKTFDELMKIVAETINERSAVIVLDEVDKLQDQNALYSLLEDLYRKCLILITNDSNYINKLDNRIKSRLIPDLLEFKPYNEEEVENILKERSNYAFVSDTLEKEAFGFIVKESFKSGDLRLGLFLLKQSGENAENKSSRKITLNHVKEALANMQSEDLETSESERLLELIKDNSGKSATEVFKIYEQKEGKSYKTFQRRLKDLEKDNRIKLREENKGFEGRQTLIEFL